MAIRIIDVVLFVVFIVVPRIKCCSLLSLTVGPEILGPAEASFALLLSTQRSRANRIIAPCDEVNWGAVETSYHARGWSLSNVLTHLPAIPR